MIQGLVLPCVCEVGGWWMETPGQYLVVHGDLQRKAQVVTEPLLVGDVQADFPRR